MSIAKMVVLVVAVLGMAACGAEDANTAVIGGEFVVTPQQACKDLQAAHREMVERCGLVETYGGLEFQYVDCSTVRDIRDMDELYSTCLPSLETMCQGEPGCYPWGTIGECHQFVY